MSYLLYSEPLPGVSGRAAETFAKYLQMMCKFLQNVCIFKQNVCKLKQNVCKFVQNVSKKNVQIVLKTHHSPGQSSFVKIS